MSDTSVIKEFLVQLGFKVDDAGFKKFEEGVSKATKAVSTLATEVVAAEGAITAAVVTIAAKFEDLYYASQRMRSTVENIRATGYSISQMGGDAQGARASLEGLAAFMRSNPSGEGFIRSLGVSTRDANGQLRDTSEIMRGLGARFAQMPYYVAKVRAGLLGIDEKTLQALIRGTDEFAERYHQMAKQVGVDQDAAAKSAHDFMTQVRDLGAYLQLLGEKFLIPLMGPLERVIGLFKDLDRASGGLSTALVVVAVALAPVFAIFGTAGLIAAGVIALADAVILLWDDFQTWREGGKSLIDWKNWSWEIDQAGGAVGELIGSLGQLGATVADLAGQLGQLIGPTLIGDLRLFIRLLTDSVRVVADLVGAVDDLLHNRWSFVSKIGKAFTEGRNLLDDKDGQGPSADARRAAQNAAGGAAAVAGPAAKALQAQRANFAVDYLKSQGISDAAARGSVAGAIAESRFDPNAVNPASGAYGIGQWLGDRKNALQAMFGRNPSFDQQLQFLAMELKGGDRGGAAVTASATPQQALYNYITKFMRPAAGGETSGDLQRGMTALASMGLAGTPQAPLASPELAAAGAGPGGPWGGGQTVVMHQKTDIHVQTTDPAQAGRDVFSSQNRVNADLLRNMQTVVQ